MSRLRLCGFPRVVKSEEAVPSMLSRSVSLRPRSLRGGGLEMRTAVCPAGPCTSAGSAAASTGGGLPASWAAEAHARGVADGGCGDGEC